MRSRIYLYSTIAVLATIAISKMVTSDKPATEGQQVVQSAGNSTTPVGVERPFALTTRTPAPPSTGAVPVHRTIQESPSWTVGYGHEFWRRAAAVPATEPRSSAVPGNVNLGDVIARVSHAIREEGPGALPMARSQTYSATFDGQGFRFSPKIIAGYEDYPDSADATFEAPSIRSRPRYQDDPQTEVMFRTVSIQQGGDSLYSWGAETVSWSAVGNTAQGLLNPQRGVIEHYECSSEGVEVTWVLQNKPQGQGPLDIDAQFTGLAYGGLSEEGHLFTDATGTPRVKVSEVTVIDAQGERTDLPLLVENSRLKVTVPGELLENAAYPLAIDPVIGPVFPLAFCMESHAQYYPAVASNGTNFLAAWSDRRNSSNHIYMTLIDANGKVTSLNGVLVTTNGSQPKVASDGTNYLVVWTDTRNATNDPNNMDIYGNRITGAGTVQDGNGFAICTASNRQERVDVASKGSDYLVVWEDEQFWGGGGFSDIVAGRVTSGGTVSTNIPVIDAGSQGYDYHPKLASDGTNYLVVWERVDTNSVPNLYIRSVQGTGTPLYNSAMLLQTNASDHGISSAKIPGKYLVTFGNTGSNGVNAVRARFAQEIAGTNSIGSLITVNTNQEPYEGQFIVTASNGTNHLVAWTSATDTNVYGTLVRATDGVVLYTNAFVINEAGYDEIDLGATSNGRDYLTVWMDGNASNLVGVDNDVFGSRIRDVDARVLDLIPISTTNCVVNPAQTYPAVAGNDIGGFLVAWVDNRNSGTTGDDIYGARVDWYGEVLDPGGIAICTATNAQSDPDVAFNGSYYLVVWRDNRTDSSGDIYGTRVNGSGTVLDGTGLAISTSTGSQTLPDVASDGAAYMVVWQDNRTGSVDVFGAAIASNGTNLNAAGFGVSTNTGNQGYPAIAYQGSNYFAVWTDTRNSGNGNDIYGARIGTNSIVLDTSGIAVCTVTQSQHRAQIAWASSTTNCLVVWQDSRNNSTTSTDIYGTRVYTSGAVSSTTGFAINIASGVQTDPALGAASDGFLVAWHQGGSPYGIKATRVDSTGTVLDATGSELVIGFTPTSPAAVSYAAVAFSYSRYLVCYMNALTGTTKITASEVTP